MSKAARRTEYTFAERIAALTRFLPVFESPDFSFGEVGGGGANDEGVITMPHFSPGPEAMAFQRAVYDYGWAVNFDWPSWQDKAARFVNEPETLASASVEDIERLLTTHLRKERFCEGHLASMYECGHLTAILRRLGEIGGIASENRGTFAEGGTRKKDSK